jgi:hypothetical protein
MPKDLIIRGLWPRISDTQQLCKLIVIKYSYPSFFAVDWIV